MKELSGHASSPVTASVGECLSLFVDLDRYPAWYPAVVRGAQVLERDGDGVPTQAQAQLHVAVGPIVREFDLRLAVQADPSGRVELARIPHDASDPEQFAVSWRAEPGRISVALDANLSVPRFLPVGGIGDTLAQGFVTAAARALSGG